MSPSSCHYARRCDWDRDCPKIMHYLLAHYAQYVYAGVLGVILAAIWILAETGVVPAWPAVGGLTATRANRIIAVMLVLGAIAAIYFDRA